MKTISLLLLLLSFSTFNAQSNLAFTQVISSNVSMNGPMNGILNTAINSSTTLTVPTGKVWKIECISFYNDNWTKTSGSTTYGTAEATPQIVIKVNGTKVLGSEIRYFGNTNNYYPFEGEINHQVIWLKAGDAVNFSLINKFDNTGYTLNGTTNIHFSAIEYTLVP
jgi:hypothetical protein